MIQSESPLIRVQSEIFIGIDPGGKDIACTKLIVFENGKIISDTCIDENLHSYDEMYEKYK